MAVQQIGSEHQGGVVGQDLQGDGSACLLVGIVEQDDLPGLLVPVCVCVCVRAYVCVYVYVCMYIYVSMCKRGQWMDRGEGWMGE